MSDLRINLHPNHSYALYIQPRCEHDIYQDSYIHIPSTEILRYIGIEIPPGQETINESWIHLLPLQPKALPGRWLANDSAFSVRVTIQSYKPGLLAIEETFLFWVGDNYSYINEWNEDSLGLKVFGDTLEVTNYSDRIISKLTFLIDVHYPVTITPCILKLTPDLFNVQDEFGPDSGELFIGDPSKEPFTATLTTTYLDKAGIHPLHDDWLIIDGRRYVVAKVRPINRYYKTGRDLPTVFSVLLYRENAPEYLLNEKQPMDFLQVSQATVNKNGKLSILIASGVAMTHYKYWDTKIEVTETVEFIDYKLRRVFTDFLNNGVVQGVWIGADGNTYLGTGDNRGLFLIKGNNFESTNITQGNVYDSIIGSDGCSYFATNQGTYKLEGGVFNLIDINHHLDVGWYTLGKGSRGELYYYLQTINTMVRIDWRTLAYQLTFKQYINGTLSNTITKSLLTDVEPILTEDEYSLLTEEEIEDRVQRLVEIFPKETEEIQYLNTPFKDEPPAFPAFPVVPEPEWIKLKESHHIEIDPTEKDLERGQFLLSFKLQNGNEVKKVIKYEQISIFNGNENTN